MTLKNKNKNKTPTWLSNKEKNLHMTCKLTTITMWYELCEYGKKEKKYLIY